VQLQHPEKPMHANLPKLKLWAFAKMDFASSPTLLD
jgi:hypothetical protein